MGISKQVRQIAIGLYTYDGQSFSAVGQYPKLYDVWNYDSRWRTDWLGGTANQRSLSGFDRINFGGFRADTRVSFRNMTPNQAEVIRELLNDVFDSNRKPRIFGISADEFVENIVFHNLRSSAYGIARQLTVGRQAVNMEFIGVQRLFSIPDSARIGQVDPPPSGTVPSAATSFFDYGKITQ